uniref:vWA domain-containing protein n=1 Tax=Vibrio caribbeanicus TaxID=701175 RepID=UPI0030DD4B0B
MSEFTFTAPLFLFVLIPWLVLMIWLAQRSGTQTLIAPHLAKALGFKSRQASKSSIFVASFAGIIAIIALAGPSLSLQERPVYTNTNARVLVMDMSMSMYANDVKPNRLTQARYKASDLLSGWSEGLTGLVAYAGDAYRISPMTSDSNTINNLIPDLKPELMPYPGSDAAAAIKLSINMMKAAGLNKGDIVLLADDLDDREREAISTQLKGEHWRLVILGIGSKAGAPIPLEDGSLMTKDNGQPVVAKSNFDNMRAVTKEVNGYFVPLQITNSDVDSISLWTQHIDLTSSVKGGQSISERINQGYYLIPLLLLPALMLFRRGFIFGLVMMSLPLTYTQPAQASPWLNKAQQANELFQEKNYADAAKMFEDKQWRGVAQYQANDFKAAIKSLENPTTPTEMYNLANAYAQDGQLEQAKDLYQKVLEQNPEQGDAKHNLSVVEKAIEQQQQQQ